MIGAVQAAKYGGVAVVGLVGLVAALFVVGVIGIPDAGLQDNDWGEVGEQRIEVVTTVWVDNPNPIGAGVDRVQYDLSMNDVHLANGTKRDPEVDPGNQTITFRTDLNYTRVPAWWATHVAANESGVRETSAVDVTATPDLRAFGWTFSRPVTYEDGLQTDLDRMISEALSELEGEYQGTSGDVSVAGTPIQPSVEVRDASAEWAAVNESRTTLDATFRIHNPNAYPIPTPGFAGEYRMNDVEVLRWHANDVDVVEGPSDGVVPPKATEEVVLQLRLDNDRFAEWFATHVEADERSNATLTAHLTLDVSGSEIRIPRNGEAVRCQYDLDTSVFVEQPAGLERRGCDYAAWSETRWDREDGGATLDLTETDWYASNGDSVTSTNDGSGGANGTVTDGSDGGLFT